MIHLTHKIDFCPAEELPSMLSLPAEDILVPEARDFVGEEAAKAFCQERGFLEEGHKFVALSVLEPKVSAASAASIKKLRERGSELAEKIETLAQVDAEGRDTWLDNMKSEIIARTQAGKSKTKSCDNCDSKVAVAYLKTVACPVCLSESFLITATDSDKIRGREERINAFRTELAELPGRIALEERKAMEGSTEFRRGWVVFGRTAEGEGEEGADVMEAPSAGGVAGGIHG